MESVSGIRLCHSLLGSMESHRAVLIAPTCSHPFFRSSQCLLRLSHICMVPFNPHIPVVYLSLALPAVAMYASSTPIFSSLLFFSFLFFHINTHAHTHTLSHFTPVCSYAFIHIHALRTSLCYFVSPQWFPLSLLQLHLHLVQPSQSFTFLIRLNVVCFRFCLAYVFAFDCTTK